MSSKQLHKHALPIVILATGVGLASIVGLINLILPPEESFVQLVTDRRVNIRPATNGLFHATHYQPPEQAREKLPPRPSSALGLSAVNSTGQNATFNAALAQ